MGLFSNNRDPAFGDRIRAAIAMAQGDTGAAARFQALQLQRQEAARQQAAAQREIETRDNQVWGAKELGYSPAQVAAMTPADISQLARANFEPRQYGPTGGSTAYTNPDGSTRYEQAPWRQEVGRSIVGAGANGADQRVIYRGQEIVPVPNVGAFGATDLGLVDPDAPPQMGFLPREQSPGVQAVQGAPQLPPAQPEPQVAAPSVEAPAFRPGPPEAYANIPSGNPLDPNLGATPPFTSLPSSAPRIGQRHQRPRGIVTVRSPEEAARLPRGTRFRTPDGRVIVRQ